MNKALVTVDWAESRVRIEHAWLNRGATDAPLLVFLHEGLGSLSAWRDFPQQLCDRLGWRGLVYSRPGYGQSELPASTTDWEPDYMHRQAHELLPALLQALGVSEAPWLLGHSDGGSIALLHAARHRCAGLIVLAPHLFVEDLSVQSITQAREAYLHTDLPQRLARHHRDADGVFWRWNRIWLSDAFRRWNIEAEVARLDCPVLAVQGLDDPYGTLNQIRRIAQLNATTRLIELPDCAHAVHKDQPEALLQACLDFTRDFRPQPHPVLQEAAP